MRAGAVEHRSVALDLAFDFFQKRAEVADTLRAASQQRKPFGRRIEERRGIGGAVQERDQIENLARFERRAFDVQFLNEDGDVRKAVEVETDRRALSGRLGSGRRT